MPDLFNPGGGARSPGDKLEETASVRLHRTNLDLVLDGGANIAVAGVSNTGRATVDSLDILLYGLATSSTVGLGIVLGEESGVFVFRIGDPAGSQLSWDGTQLNLKGTFVLSGTLNLDGAMSITEDLAVGSDGGGKQLQVLGPIDHQPETNE